MECRRPVDKGGMATFTTTTQTQPIFPWLEKYSVGISQIDAQHQGLVRLINELHAAMGAGHGKDAVGKILDELVRYTQSHFSYEETLLKQRGYSKFAAHQAIHKTLTAQVVDLREKYRANKLTLTLQVMQFLKSWLGDHIMGHDHQYAAEFKTR
jgi:hemerythrin-like metal-binding protein